MTKDEARVKLAEFNDAFTKLRLLKEKYEEEGLVTHVLEQGMAFNNGQMNVLREFLSED